VTPARPAGLEPTSPGQAKWLFYDALADADYLRLEEPEHARTALLAAHTALCVSLWQMWHIRYRGYGDALTDKLK